MLNHFFGDNNCLWIILILLCCCNNNDRFGNDSCSGIIWIIILLCLCGNSGFGGIGSGCDDRCNSCGC